MQVIFLTQLRLRLDSSLGLLPTIIVLLLKTHSSSTSLPQVRPSWTSAKPSSPMLSPRQVRWMTENTRSQMKTTSQKSSHSSSKPSLRLHHSLPTVSMNTSWLFRLRFQPISGKSCGARGNTTAIANTSGLNKIQQPVSTTSMLQSLTTTSSAKCSLCTVKLRRRLTSR
jgi:hypothetical protein